MWEIEIQFGCNAKVPDFVEYVSVLYFCTFHYSTYAIYVLDRKFYFQWKCARNFLYIFVAKFYIVHVIIIFEVKIFAVKHKKNFQGRNSACHRCCGKVMFSVVSVYMSIHRGWSQVTIAHDALNLTVLQPWTSHPTVQESPPLALPPPDMGPHCAGPFFWRHRMS